MRWVVHGQNFVSAYHAVMRNQGAAGVDGMPTEALPTLQVHPVGAWVRTFLQKGGQG